MNNENCLSRWCFYSVLGSDLIKDEYPELCKLFTG